MRAKQTAPLVNKHYEYKVTLIKQNLPLKCCPPLEMLIYFEKRIFHTFNIGSVDQKSAKLLAVKVGGLKKVCHPTPVEHYLCGPCLTLTGSESFSKFDTQQLYNPLAQRPYINCMERSKPFLNVN